MSSIDTTIPVLPSTTIPANTIVGVNGATIGYIQAGPIMTRLCLGEKIAVEPFKSVAPEMASKSAFATVIQRRELTAMLVIVGNKDIPAGSTVYVRGDLCVDSEAKKVFEFEGTKVSFIPVREVLIVSYWYQPMPIPQTTWTATNPQ
jgi:hypothetical protein